MDAFHQTCAPDDMECKWNTVSDKLDDVIALMTDVSDRFDRVKDLVDTVDFFPWLVRISVVAVWVMAAQKIAVANTRLLATLVLLLAHAASMIAIIATQDVLGDERMLVDVGISLFIVCTHSVFAG